MGARKTSARVLWQRDVVPEEARLNLKAIRGAGQGCAGGGKHGFGRGGGHDEVDGIFDAGARGGRGILAKLLVVCQLRFDVGGGRPGEA